MRSFGPSADSPRHAPLASGAVAPAPSSLKASDWGTLQRLFPYLWAYKWRVMAALSLMIGAKVANVGVPLLLKTLVDTMGAKPGEAASSLRAIDALSRGCTRHLAHRLSEALDPRADLVGPGFQGGAIDDQARGDIGDVFDLDQAVGA